MEERTMVKNTKESITFRDKNIKELAILWIILLSFFLAAAFQAFAAAEPNATNKITPANKNAITQKVLKLRLPFVANQGQINDQRVLYYARTFGGTAYIMYKGEIGYQFLDSRPKSAGSDSKTNKVWRLKEKLIGAPLVRPQGTDPSRTKVNYFVGNDPGKWKTSIPTYNAVSLGDVYKGIQLSLKAHGNTIEKIFTVRPGADPNAITIELEGADSIKIDDDGQLEINGRGGTVRLSKPVAYQEKDGKREEIEVNYRLGKNGDRS
jgi:hypothetical protein